MAERLTRRAMLRAALLGSAGLAVAACGVPGSSKPHVVGDGTSGTGTGSGAGGAEPPSPANIADPQEFVRTFLTAAAIPPDGSSREGAIKNAKTFMTSAAAAAWQPDGKLITVVRVVTIEKPAVTGSGSSVGVELVTVGYLGADGFVKPAPAGTSVKAKFELVRNYTDQHAPDDDADILWRIDAPLPAPLTNALLLSSDGLSSNLYTSQLAYFWASANGEDQNSAGLVPDLRYLPRVQTSADQWPTTIVNWLMDGPTDWLAAAVTPLTLTHTNLVLPNVSPRDSTGGTLVVNFAALPNVDPRRVAAQVRWSLRPNVPDPIVVKVGTQDKVFDGNEFINANLCDAPFRDASPTGYLIVNGQIREAADPYPIPTVFAKVNDATVVSAAITRDGRQGAVVRQDKSGRYQLAVGQQPTTGADRSGIFQDSQLSGGSMSRPVWLPARPAHLLVLVDGVLWSVNIAGQATPVTFTGAVNQLITSFAVAPDGCRIALVSGGRVAVASLTHAADTVTVGAPTSIDSGGMAGLTAVAWSRVHWLVLAGKVSENNYPLVEVSVDGALSGPVYNITFDSPVTYLASYAPLPSRGLGSSGPIMVQTQNHNSYQVSPRGAVPVPYTPVVPSPSPSGGTQNTGHDVILAPFYAD